MEALLATQQYINEMIRLASPGMKVILLDKETVCIFIDFMNLFCFFRLELSHAPSKLNSNFLWL
jgi:hypothetical protein